MNREEVLRIVEEAREENRVPDLRGADLRGADLWGADLCGADLWGADLQDADLWGADLRGADLRGADLQDADLRGAGLRGADLRGARWDGFHINGLDSGLLYLVPTSQGWQLSIGCWRHKTIDDLKALLDAPDAEWPEARGEKRKKREAILRATIPLLEAHMQQNAHIIKELEKKWGNNE